MRRNLTELEHIQSKLDAETLATIPTTDGVVADAATTETVSQVKDLIQKYEAQSGIADPLRIRLAMYYMQHGEFDLAESTLSAIKDQATLTNERDKTFFALHETVIWWSRESARVSAGPSENYLDEAKTGIDRIVKEVRRLSKDPENREIAAYYTELGVRIANYLVPMSAPSEDDQVAWNEVKPYVTAAWNLLDDVYDPGGLAGVADPNRLDLESNAASVRARMLVNETQRELAPYSKYVAEMKLDPVVRQTLLR